jgi:hypothetical protein
MKLKQQAGYSLLLFIAIIFLFSSAAVYAKYGSSLGAMKLQHTDKQLQHLNDAKANLILHAQSVPEIYATNTNGQFYAGDRISAPGYLPCPDLNNNGSSTTPCGQGQSIVIGRLPNGLASRHFRFISTDEITPFIWYAVDSRYVIQNSDYNNPPIQRFSPLNPLSPGNGRIQVDNQANLIAILFIEPNYAAASNTPLDLTQLTSLTDLTQNRFSKRDVLMVTLSHSEWQSAIHSRVQLESSVLCNLPSNQPHWFNACNNQEGNTEQCPGIYDGRPSNPVGTNWRNLLCG